MKLFDRQKKWEINLYAYYDHAGIVRHLEDMARQGWQLEKAGSVFWTYRRCKPAELRYAVVYFPKASQFDPEPPEEMARRVRRTMVAISQAIVTTYEEEERKAGKE